jgi:hypothetical protein
VTDAKFTALNTMLNDDQGKATLDSVDMKMNVGKF